MATGASRAPAPAGGGDGARARRARSSHSLRRADIAVAPGRLRRRDRAQPADGPLPARAGRGRLRDGAAAGGLRGPDPAGRLGSLAPRRERPLRPGTRRLGGTAALRRPDRHGRHPGPLHGEAAVRAAAAVTAGRGPRRRAGGTALRVHRAHLRPRRSAVATAGRGELRRERRGRLSPGPRQPARPRPHLDHWPPPRGGIEHEAVRRRARPRVRPLLAGSRHEAHVRDPPDQPLVLPRGARAGPVGPGARSSGGDRRHPDRRRAPRGARLRLAEPAHPLGPHAGRPRRQLLHAPSDGVRRRPLRVPGRGQRHVPRDHAAHRGAQRRQRGRLRRAARQLEDAEAAGQPAALHRGHLRADRAAGPRGDRPARGREEDRCVRHAPLRRQSHPGGGRARRRGCLPLERAGHNAVPGLPFAQPEGHALLLREGARPPDRGRQPGGQRGVPSREHFPAGDSSSLRELLRGGEHHPTPSRSPRRRFSRRRTPKPTSRSSGPRASG